jgi:hypothetical protein
MGTEKLQQRKPSAQENASRNNRDIYKVTAARTRSCIKCQDSYSVKLYLPFPMPLYVVLNHRHKFTVIFFSMPLSSSGHHSCFVYERDVPGSSVSPKAAVVTEAFHGFIYSREMPGQVPRRPRPPPSTSLTFYNHQSFLLFDAVQAPLLAVSLHESQINK